jgi:NAD(P)-dependent dehydrogenase (short-subunit alcohol dehydrogenase family)
MDDIRFDGQVAVVTGAGNGLGRHYALELARRGAKVVVNDLGSTGAGRGTSREVADKVVDAIRTAGGEAVANYADVANRAGGSTVVETAMENWGRVDICINNAGFLRNNRFEDLTDEQIDSITNIHLKAGFYVTQPAYKVMRSNGYGRILFTGSASGMFGHSWQSNYGAAKSAMLGLSNTVAIEGDAYGIKSNVLLPTALTRLGDEMNQQYLEIPSFKAGFESTDWPPRERIAEEWNLPLVVYLVSNQCAWTHGVFSANAGRFARVGICAAEGWVAPLGAPPSVEEIATHFDQICDMSAYHEPKTVYEEISIVTQTGRRQGVFT